MKKQTPKKSQETKKSARAGKRPQPKKSTAPTKAKIAKPKFKSPVPRAENNPFRDGSAYGIAFDVLAANPDGLTRQQLVAEVAKITGKDIKHAGYDVAVVLSAQKSPTGPRHRSCREGFWVEREGDHVRLRTA